MRLVLISLTCFLLMACQTTTNNNEATKTSATTKKKALDPIEEDLWLRVVEQFTMPIPDDPSVDYYRKWYLDHPEHLDTISERAKPFLYLIVHRLEQENMPMELALLPAVESAFDPTAYSYSSAAGLWQFIPSTATNFGLKRNYWYDGRRDVAASTDAAIKYLTYLGKFFDGNWDHAIAAYNSGEGRVQRAIRKNKSQGKPTGFFALDLPKETRDYLPKLLALADVILNQEKYGVDVPDIPNRPFLVAANPKKQLSINTVANYTGVSVEQLKQYNAGLNHDSTPPSGPYTWLIPLKTKEKFLAAAKSNPATQGQSQLATQGQLATYNVKSGDSLSKIALQYNTSVSAITSANKLPNNNIRIGQSLFIPGKMTKSKTSSSRSTTSREATEKNSRTMYYQVRKGDTLSQIAQKYKVSTADIMGWNKLGNQVIKTGQKLKLLINLK